ncbi:hypothetical protein B5M42_023555 [Paenibacillus athensensis]|uniref:DNA mismatch repair protein n=1 Tax=Paenibacillus athensensis TaxID=1967502 RepID=A0A4Y8PTJ2_9BACL|nr:hypothetical protein [Paenibacillus athensensis]MCD1261777.1 hypothetical protein [Paenibacillus athensensis]
MSINDEDIYVVSRSYMIDLGLRALAGLGAESVCRVCIGCGGSCCQNCGHLRPGVGCQSRNTSCTAWLCGYLKLLFFKSGVLTAWDAFWEQVPGLAFRHDTTPSWVTMSVSLEPLSLPHLGEALARDLSRMLGSGRSNVDFVVLAGELDELIDEICFAGSSEIADHYVRKLDLAIEGLTEFRQALSQLDARQHLPE